MVQEIVFASVVCAVCAVQSPVVSSEKTVEVWTLEEFPPVFNNSKMAANGSVSKTPDTGDTQASKMEEFLRYSKVHMPKPLCRSLSNYTIAVPYTFISGLW